MVLIEINALQNLRMQDNICMRVKVINKYAVQRLNKFMRRKKKNTKLVIVRKRGQWRNFKQWLSLAPSP